MTARENPDPTPADDPELARAADEAEADAEAEPEAEPEPEPWTPERVLEWNAYYDMYVALGVLLLVFLSSSNLIANSTLWAHLATGRLIAERGGPVTTEPFALVQQGQPWADVPWLFQVSHWLVYKSASGLAPSDPDPTVQAARAEQFGAGALVIVAALVRALAALALLSVRRKGPGLWWTAVCTTLALGVAVMPALSDSGLPRLGLLLGGIAGPSAVGPEVWGLLFLALEVAILHRATNLGRAGWAYALPLLFLLWANVDESFLFGLAVLAAATVGLARGGGQGLGFGRALAILAASALACLATPSIHGAYATALEPFLALFRSGQTEVIYTNELSIFGQGIRRNFADERSYRAVVAYFVGLIALGLGSFVLNRRRFALGRFLVFAVASVLWGVFFLRYSAEFAVILATTLALNGQEWYHDQFGVQGRLGRGWAAWSVGGRAVTIVAIFLAITLGVTGWAGSASEARFGFGFDPADFPMEAADYLRGAGFGGNVLNTSPAQGDAIVWRAYPQRRPYVDGRRGVYSREFRDEHQKLRRALSEDDETIWQPLLDAHNITAVMIQPGESPRTQQVLSLSDRWIPFYDDGAVVMYGRADAPEADLAYFRSEQLDAEALAYARPKPAPPVTLPPASPSWLDRFASRPDRARPRPHSEAAARWFRSAVIDPNVPSIPDPARCLLAIRECRRALAQDPNDTLAFRRLAEAYRFLASQESALLAGIALSPENVGQINQAPSQPNLLRLRFLQRVTALTFALQTSPPSNDPAVIRERAGLHFELAQLLLEVNYFDVARDHLEFVLDPVASANYDPAFRAQLSQELARIKTQVDAVQKEMTDRAIEQQAGPLERANIAMAGGAPGLAIEELREAQNSGISPAIVVPLLIDIYCQVGQPDKAIELLTEVDEAAPTGAAGTAAYRNGLVSLLIGNYPATIERWRDGAIFQLQAERTAQALLAGQTSIRGEVKAATSGFLELPGKVSAQAAWEFDLAIAMLEAGEPPAQVAEHFTRALTLEPELPQRPVAAYYLEKLGQPVPPPSEGTPAGSE